ncbi:hypothetical protein BG261_02925 [Floricoccus tropicus]|uniref:Uncharacterized protein n=1 Tax=Floricoccus tropicus TaxID=1859473 RepID=A0A1E8GPY4_9LACT|nr:hypothetical protein BG261_02925 [Floricoccus tropicus]
MQNKCGYCKFGEESKEISTPTTEAYITIDENNDVILSDSYCACLPTILTINYCPMCGRRLHEED